ncbi:hypothetical protein BGW38_007672 [Lunasporangiospora selenospora]|uniref:Uncharacterized protein n=1 Tax=Lunasporangiospora selenospora TaxID=979761 RepID=A0A9P6KIL4_9FUNG|nr:hypothetical protein BGW38_007672 [Lunasporangiospora selenospora]
MSDEKHNSMTEPIPADDECNEVFGQLKQVIVDKIHEINRADKVHGLHEMDKLKKISEFTPIIYAIEDVAFGRTYFAKIHLGDEKFIHARAHKSTNGDVSFYSLLTTPECAIWDRNTPLEYFID